MIIQIVKELEAKSHFCTLGAGADNSNGEILSITGSFYQFITLKKILIASFHAVKRKI